MQAYLFALGAAALWGVSPLLDKWALSRGHVTPLLAVALRAVAVAAAAWVTVVAAGVTAPGAAAQWRRTSWMEFAAVAAAGLIAAGIAQWFYFKALSASDVSLAVPVSATYPLFGALLALLMRRESLSNLRLAGIVLAVAGCLLLAWSSRVEQKRPPRPAPLTVGGAGPAAGTRR